MTDREAYELSLPRVQRSAARLAKLIQIEAPEAIIRNEARILFHAMTPAFFADMFSWFVADRRQLMLDIVANEVGGDVHS